MKKVLLPGLVSGLVMMIVGMLCMMLWGMILPGLQAEYKTALFRPWSDPRMMLFFAHPFILGLALAWVWDKVKGLVPGSIWQRGLKLGYALLLISTIPGMFMCYTTFSLSLLMVLSWTITGFIQVVIGGTILAKMNG